MKKLTKILITTSIFMLFSINILSANIPQHTTKIRVQDSNSANSLSTPKISAEGDVTSGWNYTFSNTLSRGSISRDGRYILAINISSATIFHRNSNATLWTYDAGANIVDEAMSSDGRYIVLVDLHDNVTLLDRSLKTERWNFDDYSEPTMVSVDISKYGNYITVANQSGGLYLFNNALSGGQKQPEWWYDDGTGRFYRDVAISGNGQYIVVGDQNGNITLFNTKTTSPKTYEWQFNTTDYITQVAISNDGVYLVASNINSEVYLFNTTNPQGKPMWNFTTPLNVNSIDISSNGEYIVVSDDENLYYFNNSFQSGNKTAEWSYLRDDGYYVWDNAISLDGKYVVMGTQSPTCYLFNNTKTMPKIPLWRVPILNIKTVDISNLGDYFVASSTDTNTIYLYHHDIPISRGGGYIPPGDDDDDDDDDDDTGVVIVVVVIIIVSIGGVVFVIIILIKKGIIDISKFKRG